MFDKLKNILKSKTDKTSAQNRPLSIINLNIDGMSCGHCSKEVTQLLEKLPGVSQINISHEDNKGSLMIDSTLITREVVEEIINETDKYSAKII